MKQILRNGTYFAQGLLDETACRKVGSNVYTQLVRRLRIPYSILIMAFPQRHGVPRNVVDGVLSTSCGLAHLVGCARDAL
jgi:hypothetical protein